MEDYRDLVKGRDSSRIRYTEEGRWCLHQTEQHMQRTG